MRKLFYLFIFVGFSSCTPDLYWEIKKSYNPEPQNTEVKILETNESNSRDYEYIGTMRFSGGALSSVCSYEKNIKFAQKKARKYGGNAIEIIDHELPSSEFLGLSFVYNPCHNITFKILKKRTSPSDSSMLELKNDTNPPRIIIYFQKSMIRTGRLNQIDLIGDVIPVKEEIVLDGQPLVKLYKEWELETIDKINFGKHIVTVKLREGEMTMPIIIDKNKDYYLRVRYTISGHKVIMDAVSNDLGDFETSPVHYSMW